MSKKDSTKHPLWRLFVFGTLLSLALGFMVHKAYHIQVREEQTNKRAAAQDLQSMLEKQAVRGRIYGAYGAILADSTPAFSMEVDTKQFYENYKKEPSLQTIAKEWAPLLRMTPDAIEKRMAPNRSNGTLASPLSEQEKEKILATLKHWKLKGFGFLPTSKRVYPQDALAGPLLGWVEKASGRGIAGLELAYETILGSGSSLNTQEISMDDPFLQNSVWEKAGDDVHLTLNLTIQKHAEKLLSEGVHSNHAQYGVAVVIDAKTGAILGMASVPTTSPEQRDIEVSNLALTKAFEPGSTVKMYTIAAALDAGVISPNNEWDCEGGVWQIPNFPDKNNTIHDAEFEHVLSTSQVLARSSNIGTAKIARVLGKERLFSFLKKLGFAQKTGLGFPGENPGSLRPVEKWDDLSFANISFGQGMSATATQIVSRMTLFANRGLLFDPFLVQKVTSAQGQILKETHPEGRRMIKPETAQAMLKMMRGVMQGKGTGKDLDLPEYPIAGKSGTAQEINPRNGKYDPAFRVSSFVALAPYADPRLAVGVFVFFDPNAKGAQRVAASASSKPEYWGAKIAGPVVQKIMYHGLTTLGVPKENVSLSRSWSTQ